MSKVKILDCTLRDGGYVNNWCFGYVNILKIISNLVDAKIDYVECGFLKTDEYLRNKTFFNSINQLKQFFPKNVFQTKFCLMINFGEVPIELIPKTQNGNVYFRVVFKKEKKDEAIEYCRQLMQKGYNVSVNPMNTVGYSPSEILELIEKVNVLNPEFFTIVDTNGEMKKNDVLSLFYLLNNNLNSEIKLGFHSHNNLKLSFSNALSILEQSSNRTTVIDSSVLGIGRGAGNLCTEVLTQYLNDYYKGEYKLFPVLKLVDECINPIFNSNPWGASVHYYLSATNSCHPNYASFLLDKKEMSVDVINEIFMKIPIDKKSSYDDSLIENLYNVIVKKG